MASSPSPSNITTITIAVACAIKLYWTRFEKNAEKKTILKKWAVWLCCRYFVKPVQFSDVQVRCPSATPGSKLRYYIPKLINSTSFALSIELQRRILTQSPVSNRATLGFSLLDFYRSHMLWQYRYYINHWFCLTIYHKKLHSILQVQGTFICGYVHMFWVGHASTMYTFVLCYRLVSNSQSIEISGFQQALPKPTRLGRSPSFVFWVLETKLESTSRFLRYSSAFQAFKQPRISTWASLCHLATCSNCIHRRYGCLSLVAFLRAQTTSSI